MIARGVEELWGGHDGTFLRWACALAPSPPLRKKRFAKLRPSGRVPAMFTHHRGDPTPAITRSGATAASALITIAGRKCPISARAPPAAGGREFRIDPSGAVMRSGASAPSLFGTSGHNTAFIPYDL